MRAEHFCSACGKVQPPVPVDYFTFFGLARKLHIDVAGLEREFYQLSRKLHPDLYSGADAREQEWSLEQSSQLNDAYRTLKDPIQRTEYLLREAKRRGHILEGQLIAISSLDEVIQICRTASSRAVRPTSLSPQRI